MPSPGSDVAVSRPRWAYIVVRYFCRVVYHKLAILVLGVWINVQLFLAFRAHARDATAAAPGSRRHLSTPRGFYVPLRRLLCHDWSKFSRQEYLPYAEAFFAPGGRTATPARAARFTAAYCHHVKHQDHHAEHWWPAFHPPEQATPELRVAMGRRARRMPDHVVT